MGTSVPEQETSFWKTKLRCAHTHPVVNSTDSRNKWGEEIGSVSADHT